MMMMMVAMMMRLFRDECCWCSVLNPECDGVFCFVVLEI